MYFRRRRLRGLAAAMVVLAIAPFASADEPLAYERDVRPILKVHCFHCHGDDGELQAHLDMRQRRLLVQGGDSGPALIPGDSAASLLVQRIEAGEMPPKNKKVPSAELEIVKRWIAAGAPTAAPETETPPAVSGVSEDDRAFWSFQPVQNPPLPSVRAADRVRTPIDSFLLARLEAQGLDFSPDADKHAFIRRATFDLWGLPPSPDEAAGFLADESPEAYERLIDRLLASPQYGERWGRHWLDVAGYADSDGYTVEDVVRPHAFRYRDYVIRAFNDDKPFDRFLIEQLAGDELLTPPYQNLTPEQIDSLAATGFLRMAPDGTATDGDQNTARNAVVGESLKIVGTAFLGLTVGCAQCHSHKYDPIPQADYYRLRAIFEPALDWKSWRLPNERLVSLYTEADRAAAAQVEAEAATVDAEREKKQAESIAAVFARELAKLPAERRDAARAAREAPAAQRAPEQIALLKEFPSLNVDAGSLYLYDSQAAEALKKIAERAADIRKKKPPEGFVAALTELPGNLPQTVVFHRGDPKQPRQTVEPGELSVLSACVETPLPADDAALPTSGRRLAYARHLASGRHPLVARVLVNRFWLLHFGRGLVATPGDFGRLGERPTHPELLDWLAHDFAGNGWRLKRMHKTLMLSTAYRQSSRRREQADAVDPDNKLLSRMHVRRIEAEVLRDSVLRVTGKLNGKQFGPPVPVMQDVDGQIVIGEEKSDGSAVQLPPEPLGGEEYRRSVYVQVRRTRLLSVLDAFDLPTMEPNCELRNYSTVAPQSLMLMNSPFVLAAAKDLAARLEREAGADPAAQVALAWRLAFAREISPDERAGSLAFMSEQAALYPPPEAPAAGQPAPPSAQSRALANFCQAVLTANEFLYVD